MAAQSLRSRSDARRTDGAEAREETMLLADDAVDCPCFRFAGLRFECSAAVFQRGTELVRIAERPQTSAFVLKGDQMAPSPISRREFMKNSAGAAGVYAVAQTIPLQPEGPA